MRNSLQPPWIALALADKKPACNSVSASTTDSTRRSSKDNDDEDDEGGPVSGTDFCGKMSRIMRSRT